VLHVLSPDGRLHKAQSHPRSTHSVTLALTLRSRRSEFCTDQSAGPSDGLSDPASANGSGFVAQRRTRPVTGPHTNIWTNKHMYS
jgi:hypothetical protein